MRTINSKWFILVVLVLLCFGNTAQALDNIRELQYIASDGKVVNIAATKPLTMLVIFKPECQDCQTELPLIQNIAKEYVEKLNVSLIVYGKQPKDIADYVVQFGNIANVTVYADPDKLSKFQFSIRYVPCLVFFDGNGKYLEIIQAERGVIEQALIKTTIESYLTILER
ncbi:MAG: hypothetical protein WCP79_05350 [Bacillota bacterium]